MERKLPFCRNRSWRWVRLFLLVQAGLRGGCNFCKKGIRGSLPAPNTDHPGAPQKERALLWDTRLGNYSTVLMKAGTCPLHPPPGTLELETVKGCQAHLPSGTCWQVSEYINDSSSTTKTLVAFWRITSHLKIALWMQVHIMWCVTLQAREGWVIHHITHARSVSRSCYCI